MNYGRGYLITVQISLAGFPPSPQLGCVFLQLAGRQYLVIDQGLDSCPAWCHGESLRAEHGSITSSSLLLDGHRVCLNRIDNHLQLSPCCHIYSHEVFAFRTWDVHVMRRFGLSGFIQVGL